MVLLNNSPNFLDHAITSKLCLKQFYMVQTVS